MTKLVTLHDMQLYKPAVIPEEDAAINVLYLKSSDGADWYESQIHFSPDTRKIAFEESGRIAMQGSDIQRMWPANMSITEVHEADLPADFPGPKEICFGWYYLDGKVQRHSEWDLQQATKRQTREMDAYSKRINQLVEAQDDGDITPEEVEELTRLRAERAVWRRLDLSAAPDVAWPEFSLLSSK